MNQVVVELTDRCNLTCQHCWSGRHGGRDELPLEILQRILADAKLCGFDRISFTGGEVTIYRAFAEALRLTCETGYKFGLSTNGWAFANILPVLLRHREHLRVITFGLDGASSTTHDAQRGRNAFHRLMQAISLCVIKELPFSFNTTITTRNYHELNMISELAARLGSQGIRFSHLMPTPLTSMLGLDLSAAERKKAEAHIWYLRRTLEAPPISLAAGHYTTDLFPCAPLNLAEVNVNCRGFLTTCCSLSGHGNDLGQGDVIGDLREMSFVDAFQKLKEENKRFRTAKLAHLESNGFADTDYFHCWYCTNHYRKLDWLKSQSNHTWASLVW